MNYLHAPNYGPGYLALDMANLMGLAPPADAWTPSDPGPSGSLNGGVYSAAYEAAAASADTGASASVKAYGVDAANSDPMFFSKPDVQMELDVLAEQVSGSGLSRKSMTRKSMTGGVAAGNASADFASPFATTDSPLAADSAADGLDQDDWSAKYSEHLCNMVTILDDHFNLPPWPVMAESDAPHASTEPMLPPAAAQEQVNPAPTEADAMAVTDGAAARFEPRDVGVGQGQLSVEGGIVAAPVPACPEQDRVVFQDGNVAVRLRLHANAREVLLLVEEGNGATRSSFKLETLLPKLIEDGDFAKSLPMLIRKYWQFVVKLLLSLKLDQIERLLLFYQSLRPSGGGNYACGHCKKVIKTNHMHSHGFKCHGVNWDPCRFAGCTHMAPRDQQRSKHMEKCGYRNQPLVDRPHLPVNDAIELFGWLFLQNRPSKPFDQMAPFLASAARKCLREKQAAVIANKRARDDEDDNAGGFPAQRPRLIDNPIAHVDGNNAVDTFDDRSQQHYQGV